MHLQRRALLNLLAGLSGGVLGDGMLRTIAGSTADVPTRNPARSQGHHGTLQMRICQRGARTFEADPPSASSSLLLGVGVRHAARLLALLFLQGLTGVRLGPLASVLVVRCCSMYATHPLRKSLLALPSARSLCMSVRNVATSCWTPALSCTFSIR
jgi:hypothetical protein